MVKKLKYLLFIIPFFTFLNVNAQTYTLSFNRFRTTAVDMTSSISCNNTSCNVVNVPFGNYTTTFEWTANNVPSCSGNTQISGSLASDNPSFGITNSDFSWNRLYLSTNGFDYPCAFSANQNGTAFSCSTSNLGSTFSISYVLDNNFNTSTTLNSIISRSFNINCDNSAQEIIENNNFNTDRIINNDLNGYNSITDNQDANTQDIINNQNQNTQQEIESQKVCNIIDSSYIVTDQSSLGSTGQINPNQPNDGITDYIDVSNSSLELLSQITSINAYMCYYTSSKSLVNCISTRSATLGLLTIPTNAKYIRATIRKTSNSPSFKLCRNGNQALTDSITSEQTPNTSQDIQDMDNMVASDTPISDLITMPLTLINAYINGVNSSCSSVNLGNLYGTDLILPCINLEQRLGSNLWGIIDALFSIFMCYNIGMLFITAFDGITSLRDDFEGLYQPRHADTGYQPKHGG